jgi:hypothetical protein
MKTFKDNAGRTWTIAINVNAIKRVRDLAKVNLLEAADGKLFERLIDDSVLLVDAIYAACKPEADAASVTDEDFGRAMAGDAIEHATAAMLEELAAFFPKGKRQILTEILSTLKAMEEKSQAAAMRRLESGAAEQLMERAIAEHDRALQKMLSGSSGSLPESSASTQDP